MSINKFNVDVGTKIRNYRISLGYSKEKFASMLNISVSSLSNVESGKNSISVKLLKNLFSTFGISSDDIINGTQKSNSVNTKINNILCQCGVSEMDFLYEHLTLFVNYKKNL